MTALASDGTAPSLVPNSLSPMCRPSGRLQRRGPGPAALHRLQLHLPLPAGGGTGPGARQGAGDPPLPLPPAPRLTLALHHRRLQAHPAIPPLPLPGELHADVGS